MQVSMQSSKSNQNGAVFRYTPALCARFLVIAVAGLAPMCVDAQSPGELMANADQLGDRSDWRNTGPLYAEAEAEFHRTGDARNELYAKLGRLHRDLEDGSYKSVRAEVLRLLATPLTQSDPLLQIRALAAVVDEFRSARSHGREVLAVSFRSTVQRVHFANAREHPCASSLDRCS
jgi:hypothetical protein